MVIKPFNNENLIFQLINLKGIILLDKKVESEETEISMEKYSPSIYLLKVLNDGQIVKVVKIAKIKMRDIFSFSFNFKNINIIIMDTAPPIQALREIVKNKAIIINTKKQPYKILPIFSFFSINI